MPVEDPKEELRQVFEENIDRLRITTLFPAAVRERMVFGAYLSLLVYNADRKVFTDTIPFEYKNTEVQSNVLYGGDPTIVVRLAEDQRRFLVQSHLHDQEYRKNPLTDKIGPKLMELLRSGPFELDALSSLYFPNNLSRRLTWVHRHTAYPDDLLSRKDQCCVARLTWRIDARIRQHTYKREAMSGSRPRPSWTTFKPN